MVLIPYFPTKNFSLCIPCATKDTSACILKSLKSTVSPPHPNLLLLVLSQEKVRLRCHLTKGCINGHSSLTCCLKTETLRPWFKDYDSKRYISQVTSLWNWPDVNWQKMDWQKFGLIASLKISQNSGRQCQKKEENILMPWVEPLEFPVKWMNIFIFKKIVWCGFP